jgi:hypothetical protein
VGNDVSQRASICKRVLRHGLNFAIRHICDPGIFEPLVGFLGWRVPGLHLLDGFDFVDQHFLH